MNAKKMYRLQLKAPSKMKKKQSSLVITSSIFGDDDDYYNDVENEISRQASNTNKESLGDPFAFAYDQVYDDMKQRRTLMHITRQERKPPRYIMDLKKQAERRVKEREIVYERKLAKERDKDKHLFPDQVNVITGVYKRKLEERDRWLYEERLRDLVDEKDDITKKKDLSDFYFNTGINVAFGPSTENKTDSPVLSESGYIGSLKKKKKLGSIERDSPIERATYQYRRSKDVILAAKERFLDRKRAKD